MKSRYRLEKLTHSSYNLGLHSELIGETTGKIGDAALTISCHVWDLPDVIEHVTTCEE